MLVLYKGMCSKGLEGDVHKSFCMVRVEFIAGGVNGNPKLH